MDSIRQPHRFVRLLRIPRGDCRRLLRRNGCHDWFYHHRYDRKHGNYRYFRIDERVDRRFSRNYHNVYRSIDKYRGACPAAHHDDDSPNYHDDYSPDQ